MILTGKEEYGESFPRFNPIFTVVGCFVFCEDEMLLLERHSDKPQGGTWGIPGGKVKGNEPFSYAKSRELYEETKIICHISTYFGSVKVRYQAYDFLYAMFGIRLTAKPDIHLDHVEHVSFVWMPPADALRDALTLPLIEDMGACIERVISLEAA